jgi:hypothetical protein
LIFACVAPAAAQPIPKTEIQVNGGIFMFDLLGVGTENYVAMALSRPVIRDLSIKASVTYTNTLQRYVVRIPYLIPEMGVEWSKPLGILKPYIGAGMGVVCDMRTEVPDSVSFISFSGTGTELRKSISTDAMEENTFDASYYLELGIKIPLPNQVSALGLSAKLRGHELDVSGFSNEFGIGLSTSF